MSWWAYLRDADGETLRFEQKHRISGGTYAIGGTDTAELNITYNYSPHYYRVFPQELGLRWLDGKRGRDSLPVLEAAIAGLNGDEAADYWAPTEGNARKALLGLLHFARSFPDGLWRIS